MTNHESRIYDGQSYHPVRSEPYTRTVGKPRYWCGSPTARFAAICLKFERPPRRASFNRTEGAASISAQA